MKAHKFLYFSELSDFKIFKILPTKSFFFRVHHLNDRLTSQRNREARD